MLRLRQLQSELISNRVVIECLCVRVFIYYACIGFNYVVSVFVFAVMFGFRGRRFVSKISVSSQT